MTTDWANEMARAIFPLERGLAYRPHEDEIAAALRKTKADGMREAAFIAYHAGPLEMQPICTAIGMMIEAASNLIDKAAE